VKIRVVALLPFLLVALATPSPASAVSSTRALVPYDLFAVVNPDGTVARATPGTVAAHVGAGRYDVTFPASVKGCAAVANLGYAGSSEVFTFVAAVTVSLSGHTARVDVTYPGDTTAGSYPHRPVLRDNSFHLHVDCGHALFAVVNGAGTLRAGSASVTLGAHTAGSGRYTVDFGRDISTCAPVATVHDGFVRIPFSAQAHLALGADRRSLTVFVNRGSTGPVDWGFDVIVTCGEQPAAVFPVSNGFWNFLVVPHASSCALTASWYDPSPGSTPQNQGYVSTWAVSSNVATLQTKNGGYGVEPGFGAALVASC
jgi:hypothetical protein